MCFHLLRSLYLFSVGVFLSAACGFKQQLYVFVFLFAEVFVFVSEFAFAFVAFFSRQGREY